MAMDFQTAPFPGPLTMEPELPYAGFWRRTLAWLIDAGLAVAAWIVGFVLIAFIGGFIGASDAAVNDAIGWPLAIALLVFVWLYSTLMEASRRQATLGKLGAGIVVAHVDGGRISWARANLRFWSKLISALPFFIGFLIAGVTARKQALHDMIAGTLVLTHRVPGERPLPNLQPGNAVFGSTDPARLNALTAKFVPERLPFLRRAKRKYLQRGVEALAAVLEANEDAQDLAHTSIGPSPLLLYELGGLYAEMIFLKPHYIAITDRRVILIRASRWSARGRSLVLAEPRDTVTAERFKPGVFRYTAFFLRTAGGDVRRLNFRRALWKPEAETMFRKLQRL